MCEPTSSDYPQRYSVTLCHNNRNALPENRHDANGGEVKEEDEEGGAVDGEREMEDEREKDGAAHGGEDEES